MAGPVEHSAPEGENGPARVWGNVSSPGLNPPSYAPQAHALPTCSPEHPPAERSGWEWGEGGTESGLLCIPLTPKPFSTYGLQRVSEKANRVMLLPANSPLLSQLP